MYIFCSKALADALNIKKMNYRKCRPMLKLMNYTPGIVNASEVFKLVESSSYLEARTDILNQEFNAF